MRQKDEWYVFGPKRPSVVFPEREYFNRVMTLLYIEVTPTREQ